MDERHRAILRFNHVRLVEDIVDVPGICDRLLQSNILTWSMIEEINAENTHLSKVRKLLVYLPKRGPEAFQTFLTALQDTANKHLAEVLEPPDESEDGTKDNESGFSTRTSQPTDSLPRGWPPFNPNKEIRVLQCDPTDVETQRLLIDSDNVYRMKSIPRGRALLINNINYKKSAFPLRRGVHLDSIGFDLLFHQLDFEVEHHIDLKYKATIDLLQSESSRDHAGFDCFVLVFNSYGDNTYIYSTDGKKMEINDIMAHFDGINCPSLSGKPKIFFFLNGLFEKMDEGVLVHYENSQGPSEKFSPKTFSSPSKSPVHMNGKTTPQINVADGSSSPARKPRSVLRSCGDVSTSWMERIPTKADMICGVSTVPGYSTFRTINFGSWYIQAIIHVFQKFAHKDDLAKLLRKVNCLVAKGSSRIAEDRYCYKQMPMFQSTLRKDLLFFPGIGRKQPEEPNTGVCHR